MSKLNFNTLHSKEKLKAVLYKKGMEDGFITKYVKIFPENGDLVDLYYNKSQYRKTEEYNLEVKIPYVTCPDTGDDLPVCEGYYIVQTDVQFGTLSIWDKEYVENNYE